MQKPLLLGFMCFWVGAIASAQSGSHPPQGYCPQVVEYTYYKICYDSHHRQARWVNYHLTRESINGKQKRTNDYRMDPNIEDPVFATDYRGSGFDRGHLLPAADMKLNYRAMSETFFMTNMSPQRPGFNRYIWASIERRVRSLVRQHGEAYVVTGGLLNPGLPMLQSGVSIPEVYFKVMYFPVANIMKAFLIENRDYGKGTYYSDFLVPVDDVEDLTGYDFFSDLADSLENQLEATLFRE